MPKQKQFISIQQLLADTEHRFALSGVDRNEARDLLAFVVNTSTGYLITNKNNAVPTKQYAAFSRLVKKRISGFPFAYLVGRKGFYGLEFFVNQSVLIPRPETESLIDWVIKNFTKEYDGVIADIGTGSGCIAVTLAKYIPKANILAVDVSQAALTIAKKNARANKVQSKIRFVKSNLLQSVRNPERIDLLIANLPYLTNDELGNVPFEPVKALYGGKLGLELIEKCIAQIERYEIKQAILEISPTQEHWLTYSLQRQKAYSFEFIEDLSKQIRFLVLKRIQK